MSKEIERRFIPAEIRVEGGNGEKRIVGYSARFNAESEDLGGFTEFIAPGAFTNALKNADTRFLFNHDPNHVLGRTTAGTLMLTQDEHGLRSENIPPDTQWARDLMVSMERGDITAQSFGFRVAENGDKWEMRDGKAVRTITEIAELLDTSVVTYPAYRQTDASVALRSLEEWKKELAPEIPEELTLEREKLKLNLAKSA